MDEARIRVALREESEEFHHLEEKHHQYEEELKTIADKAFLSPEELVKKKDLKKHKLQVKDKIHQLMLDYQKGV